MWYVVQVVGGRERRVLHLVEQLVDDDVLQECFIPQYEIMKKIKGEWRRRSEILLPGYLFLITIRSTRLRTSSARFPRSPSSWETTTRSFPLTQMR